MWSNFLQDPSIMSMLGLGMEPNAKVPTGFDPQSMGMQGQSAAQGLKMPSSPAVSAPQPGMQGVTANQSQAANFAPMPNSGMKINPAALMALGSSMMQQPEQQQMQMPMMPSRPPQFDFQSTGSPYAQQLMKLRGLA